MFTIQVGKTAKFLIGPDHMRRSLYRKTDNRTVSKNGDYASMKIKICVGDGPGKYAVLDYGVNGLRLEFGRVFLTAI